MALYRVRERDQEAMESIGESEAGRSQGIKVNYNEETVEEE